MNIVKFLSVALLSILVLALVSCGAGADAQKVSVGLDVLADRAEMVKTGLVGGEISFCTEDFERALNLSEISSITITKLPNTADGTLYLGAGQVSVGQVISAANLSYLKFSSQSSAIRDSSFCFSVDGNYELTCSLRMVEGVNYSPSVSSVGNAVLTVSTYKNISVYGALASSDPEGDDVRYEIVSLPENGLLIPLDDTCSTYRYIPNKGYTGKDSFCYVAIDKYGNYSEAAKVTLKVEDTKGMIVFGDLDDSVYHVPAMSLVDKGIMASTKIGEVQYFYPEKAVSRMDFLVMAMKTMNVKIIAPAKETVFADDALIPTSIKPYVNTAERMGYICGKINEKGELVFAPDDAITVAEAAVILANMANLDVPTSAPVLAEGSEVPAWAEDAVFALASAGVVGSMGDVINASAPLSRGQSAQMLYNLGKAGD